MDAHKTAAGLHVLFKRCLQISRPSIVRRVVVEHYSLILPKVGLEPAEVPPRRRCSNNVHLKQSSLVELFTQHSSYELPFVIWSPALAIKNHDAEGRGGARSGRDKYGGPD